LSDRVPFGTGNAMKKWLSGEEDLTKAYNFNAFIDLKMFFDLINTHQNININAVLGNKDFFYLDHRQQRN